MLCSVCHVLIDVVFWLMLCSVCLECLLGLSCSFSLLCSLWAQIVVLVFSLLSFLCSVFLSSDYYSCFVFAEFFFPGLTFVGFLFCVFALFRLKLLSCWAQFVVTQYFLLRLLCSVCSALFLLLRLLSRNGRARASFCWGFVLSLIRIIFLFYLCWDFLAQIDVRLSLFYSVCCTS